MQLCHLALCRSFSHPHCCVAGTGVSAHLNHDGRRWRLPWSWFLKGEPPSVSEEYPMTGSGYCLLCGVQQKVSRSQRSRRQHSHVAPNGLRVMDALLAHTSPGGRVSLKTASSNRANWRPAVAAEFCAQPPPASTPRQTPTHTARTTPTSSPSLVPTPIPTSIATPIPTRLPRRLPRRRPPGLARLCPPLAFLLVM